MKPTLGKAECPEPISHFFTCSDCSALSVSPAFCANLFVLMELRYTQKRQTKNSVTRLQSIVTASIK